MSKLTPTQSSWVRETSVSILKLIAEADEGSTEPTHGLNACVLAAAALAIELGISGNCLARMAKFARDALSEPGLPKIPTDDTSLATSINAVYRRERERRALAAITVAETSQTTQAAEPPAAAPELHKEQHHDALDTRQPAKA